MYTLKVVKQKLLIDGVEYVLNDMFGLENKKSIREVHVQIHKQTLTVNMCTCICLGDC